MQNRSAFRRLILSAAFSVVATLGIVQGSEACSHAPPAPPMLTIQQIDATHFCILIKNYNTGGGALPGDFCTCALKKLGPIISIDSFQMQNCDGGAPVAGWAFVPNNNSGAAWSSILAGPATGFASAVSALIGQGRCIDLKFIVTVGPGTTGTILASALAAGGNVVGNGKADPTGVPIPGMFEFRPSGMIVIIPPGGTACPADFNQDGSLGVQDIFDFLAAYFTNDPRADVNFSGTINVQDIFDFLIAYFGGCP